MVKQTGLVELNGEILESLPNAMFRVRLEDGRVVLGQISGKMRLYKIKVMPGDQVVLAFSPYD